MKNRMLVTCPVCNTDQHVYGNAICNHNDNSTLRCSGSRTQLINGRPARTFKQRVFEKNHQGITYRGFYINQKFYITASQVTVGQEYELREFSRGSAAIGYELNLGGTKVEVTQYFSV